MKRPHKKPKLSKKNSNICHLRLFVLKKQYHIRGISNNWFRSYLSDTAQFVSINGFNSDYKTVNYVIQNNIKLAT